MQAVNFHRGGGATLAVVIHGLNRTSEAMSEVCDAVREALPGCDVYVPRAPYSWFLTMAKPDVVVDRLLCDLDEIWAAKAGGYDEIVLVGHSMGSLLVRKVAILAHGKRTAAFEGRFAGLQPRPWAVRISRLVLLAGLTRGWQLTSASDWLTSFYWAVGVAVFETLPPSLRPFLLETRSGAPFVVQTRLQWVALMDAPDAPRIDVVQMLGTLDDLVSPADNVDYAVDRRREDGFVLLEMPDTDHLDAIRMSPVGDRARSAARRRDIFTAALTRPLRELEGREEAVAGALLFDGEPVVPDRTVTDVVFVIHGIRDKGFWTQKIARAIKRHAAQATARGERRVFRSMTLSYGYLAMAPFVIPRVRRRKTAWLMDRYVEARALYPAARISYVGHSNGTYLAARALADYPAATFHRIVFAGSVVRTDFGWAVLTGDAGRRVDAVLNYVATKDLVVALFPGGLEPFRRIDLGGAGHRGFRDLAGTEVASDGKARVTRVELGGGRASFQVNYVTGGHSAGIRESQWDEIAGFVVDGTAPAAANPDYDGRQSWPVATAGLLSTPALALGVALLVGIGAVLLSLQSPLWFLAYLGVLLVIALKV